jgi:hypothetical protein
MINRVIRRCHSIAICSSLRKKEKKKKEEKKRGINRQCPAVIGKGKAFSTNANK